MLHRTLVGVGLVLLLAPATAFCRAGGGGYSTHVNTGGETYHAPYTSTNSGNSDSTPTDTPTSTSTTDSTDSSDSTESSATPSTPSTPYTYSPVPEGIGDNPGNHDMLFFLTVNVMTLGTAGMIVYLLVRRKKPVQLGVAAAVSPVVKGLAKIHETDPAFTEAAWRERVEPAFFAIQGAWQKRNLDGARAYLSDGMIRKFQGQLDDLAQKHQINLLQQLTLHSVRMTQADQKAGVDTIKAEISASCVDYIADDRTQQMVSGSKEVRSFVEVWTFIRTTGALTVPPAEQKCPSCQAPLNMVETGRCQACQHELKSVAFDWVLDLIEQT